MLSALPQGWKIEKDTLTRKFLFHNFMSVMRFMNKISITCDEIDHHPDWRNVYTTLYVNLTTHEAGNTLTEKDISLAEIMEKEFLKYSGTSVSGPDSLSP